MDAKSKGAWLVHHMNKLRQVTNAGEFDNINTAGKMGVLMSGLSATEDGSLATAQVNAIARASNINQLELHALLEQLAHRKLVIIGAAGVDVLGLTSATVLTHTASAFEDSSPTASERAVVDLAEKVSVSPIDTKFAAEYVSDTFQIPGQETVDLLGQTEEIGFVDAEELEPGRKLLFNGNLFRRDSAKKISSVLGSLTADDHRRALQVEALLKERGCVPLDDIKAQLGLALFEKLHSIGMYDVNEVSNDVERILYVTRPAAFGKFGDPLAEDAMDLAKAFVTCLKYGMTRRDPGQGRISMLQQLMRKLIRGGWVGPATAIGQDYKVLETKRVVELKYDKGTQFSMRLLKKDIGELALKVLTEGDASDESLPNFPGASVARYTPPEETRVGTRKKQNQVSKKATGDILLALRTGK